LPHPSTPPKPTAVGERPSQFVILAVAQMRQTIVSSKKPVVIRERAAAATRELLLKSGTTDCRPRSLVCLAVIYDKERQGPKADRWPFFWRRRESANEGSDPTKVLGFVEQGLSFIPKTCSRGGGAHQSSVIDGGKPTTSVDGLKEGKSYGSPAKGLLSSENARRRDAMLDPVSRYVHSSRRRFRP
jgi:hypothetical protein